MTDHFHTIRGQYEDRKLTALEAVRALEARILDRAACSPVEREDCLEYAAKIVDGPEANPLTEEELRAILDDSDIYFPAN